MVKPVQTVDNLTTCHISRSGREILGYKYCILHYCHWKQ